MRKVKMTESLTEEDLANEELANMTRKGLIKKFFDSHSNVVGVSISISYHDFLDGGATLIVEGTEL